jgi:tetratricopeptide (TPR) repeat protein
LLVQAGRYLDAKALLGVALRSESDPTVQGQIHYSLGYCATKLGDAAEAERLLRVARDQLKTQHPTDADAAYALGRLRQEAGDFKEAAAFYEDVLVSHPEAPVAPLARLGRGVCRLALAQDEAGLTDLQDLVNEIGAKKSRQKFKPDVVAGLRKGAALLAERGNYQGDLELLAREQTLEPKPSPDFFNRLAAAFARRAEQVERSLPEAADVAERLRRAQQVRDLRTKAGDAYVAYSRSVTVDDDKAYGEALWKGVDLYDRAGNISHAISALELFVAERPTDGAAPEALLRLGKAYQAAGQFDKAISAYQRNQSRYPQSLAAAKSGVPLAQAYVAQGPQSYPNAEKALLRVVDDNPLITPDAEEFRLALFELAQLYYRSDSFEQSIARLEELTDRYPGHEHTAQLLFMMADGYRKSGALLDARVASADPGAGAASAATQAEAAAQKQERLTKAQALYDQVIAGFADGQPAPVDPLDKLYLKLSHFYRADCAYDLGRYDDAIRLYQTAASRYQDDSSAMSAHVQIVNAYCSSGRRSRRGPRTAGRSSC